MDCGLWTVDNLKRSQNKNCYFVLRCFYDPLGRVTRRIGAKNDKRRKEKQIQTMA